MAEGMVGSVTEGPDRVDVEMKVLIVESNAKLSDVWRRHLERHGLKVSVTSSSDSAVALISAVQFDVIVLNLVLRTGSALAVADYVQYRHPGTNVIFVTDTTFFSDGSIFSVTANARALIETGTPPEDLAAMVEHFGTAAAS